MRGVVMYGPGDVRVEDVAEPKIDELRPMGHEYVGIVEEVGSDVRTVRRRAVKAILRP
jgi:threonine dehydrogenase-like Zn-dependent dehydrogenase